MSAQEQKKAKKLPGVRPGERWELRLYVAGQTGKSMIALSNLRSICETHLPGRWDIEVIDLNKEPKIAKRDQILIIPTLVKTCPAPQRTIFGDLTNRQRVLLGLDLSPQ